MHQKPQCHECMGTDLNMKATATKVQILLKLFHLLMHLFSPLPVLGSPTPSSIPAGNSAHSSEALSDFQCSSKNCLLLHSTQKSLRCCCFSSVCPSVTLSLSLSDRRSGYRIWPFFSPSPTIFNLRNAQVVWSGCVTGSGYKSVVINT